MKRNERESEKTEILSHFVENLQSRDRDLFDGIKPGCLSRADMDLLDLVLFMVPVVQHSSADYKERLGALAPQPVQRYDLHGHDINERPPPTLLATVQSGGWLCPRRGCFRCGAHRRTHPRQSGTAVN